MAIMRGHLILWVDRRKGAFHKMCCFLKFINSERATKFCKMSTIDLTVSIYVKCTVEILQKFVAFSEYMYFISICRILNFGKCGSPFRLVILLNCFYYLSYFFFISILKIAWKKLRVHRLWKIDKNISLLPKSLKIQRQ